MKIGQGLFLLRILILLKLINHWLNFILRFLIESSATTCAVFRILKRIMAIMK